VLRYYITDRKPLGGAEALVANIARQLAAGIERVQIREKDLPPRELARLVRRVLQLPNPMERTPVNDRADIVGLWRMAHPLAAPSLHAWQIVPAGFLSVSLPPSMKSVARKLKAPFRVFGPVFFTVQLLTACRSGSALFMQPRQGADARLH
jgi:hypothetical protein